eukprot:1157031-Pelagomonas_calceolata.AAC.2
MDTRAAVVAPGAGESHFNGSGKEHQGPQAATKTDENVYERETAWGEKANTYTPVRLLSH